MRPLLYNEVHLWSIKIYFDTSQFLELLSEHEIKKADTFKFPKLKERYLRNRIFLRFVLAYYTSVEPKYINIQVGAFGKPYIQSPFCFNMSHANDLLVLGVQLEANLGIDVELIDPSKVNLGLVKQVLTIEEMLYFNSIPFSMQRDYFFKSWCRKEACMKADGNGFGIDPKTFSVRSNINIELKIHLNNESYYVADYEGFEGYASAIASDRPYENVRHNAIEDAPSFMRMLVKKWK